MSKGAKNQVWKYHLNGQWYDDPTVQVECADQPIDCCQKISVESQGGVLEHYREALGDYTIESTDESSGKSIYHHQTNLVSIYLHHTVDNDHNWSGWQFTRDDTDVFGFLAIENDDKCPSGKP